MSRYSWRRQHPMQKTKPMGSVPSKVKDFDHRFPFRILKSAPEKMKGRVVEETKVDMGLYLSTI
eukprot:5160956-Prorocentrum_lima.AAC.1